MAKLKGKKRELLLSSLILVVTGFIAITVGFFVADNKLENLRWKSSPPFYQTVRVNEKNELKIEVRFGPFQITSIW